MAEFLKSDFVRDGFKAATALLGITGLVGCGYVKDAVNPASSVTTDVGSDTSLAHEIQATYPGATTIRETNAENNPNIVTWFMPDGKRCDAIGSAVKNRYTVAAHLITAPYCRVVPA